ncbi:mechanosensitive ion channel family protein [bacterium]|nr:mechanosensitive ion channel family protein [bacterium]
MFPLILAQATDGLTDACSDPPGAVCEFVFDLTSNGAVSRIADWFVARPLKVIVIFLIAWIVVRLVRRMINRFVDTLVESREQRATEREQREVSDGRFHALTERAMSKALLLSDQAERGKQRARALGGVLSSVASLVIYGLALFMALGEFDVSLGPLIAGAGIVGVAVGFGAQTLVRDFLSGIFMLIEDQFGVGDIIDVGEAAGVVEEVNLRSTRIRDVHGTVWFVPNGEIRRIGNKSQQWARAVLDVEVAYETNINHAVSVIKAVADTVWEDQLDTATVLEEPEIWGVETFGASAIAIRLVLKVEPGEQFATAREVRKRLLIAFEAEGIEIPFPQRTVWMHQMDQPAAKPKIDPSVAAKEFESRAAPEEAG